MDLRDRAGTSTTGDEESYTLHNVCAPIMMAQRVEVTPLPPFDPLSDPSSLSQRWKTWKRRFETYLVAVGVTDDNQKRALLLYQAGQETQDLFDTLTDTGTDYKTAMDKLDAYFTPKKNIDFEVFQFRQAKQNEGETLDQFVTRLRKLAFTCEFTDLEKELKSAVIQNCKSKQLRRYALREDDLTLDKLTAKARALEISERQAKGMEELTVTDSVSVNRLSQQDQPGARSKKPQQLQSAMKSGTTQCRKCGGNWPHSQGPCPAAGKYCHKCKKPNHFARMCMSRTTSDIRCSSRQEQHQRQIHQVNTELTEPATRSQCDSSEDDEFLFALDQNISNLKAPRIILTVNGVLVSMTIDTGASINIVDEATYAFIAQQTPIELQPTSTRIFAYGSKTQLVVLGKFETTIKMGDKATSTIVYVVQGTHGSLLSYTTALTLNVIDVKVNAITTGDRLTQKYPSLFNGVGKLKHFEVKLHIDKSIQPVAQSARRIPFHLRKQVATELERLEQQGIIETVNGPTPWVSPLVVIPKKNGEVRLCIDMRMANKAIQRERHPTPTVDEITHTLNGATVFSKLDLRSGYHQLSLAPESRYITTFVSHKGLRRYTRLNFGTSSASELFQHVISEQIRDIPGVLNVSDDLVVFGKTQELHDESLEAVFKRFANIGLTLNIEKCEFSKDSISFFGLVFSPAGVSPDPSKVKAIHQAQPPTTVSAVRSFLGMATYCAKFIPQFSDITKPLRDLTKKNAQFSWQEEQQQALQKVKDLLTSDTVIAYFDKGKQTELVTDASPWGLSAILSQRTCGQDDRKIVAFVSRSLSSVEQRYSQTEREALAIVWAVERLHLYLCGGHFTLLTDCKPIELILNNPRSKPPARIERWNLRLQEYDFTVVHTKGSNNPSDFLSRHPSQETCQLQEKIATRYVNFISQHAVPKAMSLSEIEIATKEDVTLQKVADLVHTNNWELLNGQNIPPQANMAELKRFAKVRDELTVNADASMVLRGSRIVIPAKLRTRAINIAHEGHQGIVKTKQLLREKIWFPGMDDEVKRIVGNCLACQANGPNQYPEPLQMSPLPPEPWHTVHVDFCGPLPICWSQ